MTTCDCPFCPLIERNIQTCDVKVRIVKKKDGLEATATLPSTLTEGRDADEIRLLHKCFNTLAVVARQELLEQKMCASRWESKEAEYAVRKLRDNTWKVCFHAKTEEDPE